jgi:acyl-CoA reductase-like NAD-dependent aldehyde dehydrogenase
MLRRRNAGVIVRAGQLSNGEAYIESSPIGIIFRVEPWNFPYSTARSLSE